LRSARGGNGRRTKSVNEKSSEDAGLCCFSRKFYKVENRRAGYAKPSDRTCTGQFRMHGQVLRTSEMGGFGSGGAQNGNVGVGFFPHFEETIVFGLRGFRVALRTVDASEFEVRKS